MSNYSRELHMMLKKTMSRAYSIHANSQLGSKNGKVDFFALDLLSRLREQPSTLKDLANESEFSRVDLKKYVGSLVKMGYISKEVNDKDKRAIWLSITASGEFQLESALQQLKAPLDFALSDLTLNEEKAVLKYLSRLHQGLKQLEEGQKP